jgi:hypothetical protein
MGNVRETPKFRFEEPSYGEAVVFSGAFFVEKECRPAAQPKAMQRLSFGLCGSLLLQSVTSATQWSLDQVERLLRGSSDEH